jgi:hypothetical protein
MMTQIPKAVKEEMPRTAAPEESFCYGCGHYGLTCVRPCYCDQKKKSKAQMEF